MDSTSFELTEQQEKIKAKAHEFGKKWAPFITEWDKMNKSPLLEMIRVAGEFELLGLTIPKEYGGQDLSVIEYVIAIEEICRATGSWLPAETIFRTSAAGPSIIMASENKDVKDKFLPSIVAGKKTCAIALTEPRFGSALTDLETSAVLDGDHYIINGSKRFITGALEDDLYATFVRFKNIPGAKGIGAVIVEKGAPGLTIEEGPEVMGARGCPHGDMFFEDCIAPKENFIIGEGKFSKLMTAFNMERMHNASVSAGLALGAFDAAIQHARSRKQFGRHIWEFQSIYHMIADMWVKIEAARYLNYVAAANAVDGKYPKAREVSVAKLHANEVALNVCWAAVQILGGDGVTIRFPPERCLRDVMVASMGGGTAQILKNVIASQVLGERLDQHRQ
ncbi:MAG: acyl-CoA/acyl-ACP dehydrogenase [Deltaproteobacteria bacterium]|nr:acyl-CoA/acyl-ACP dehydrogenase [Deltaproteobacteria bacterium]